eukprot:7151945-Karenia_brevis.AAC.1
MSDATNSAIWQKSKLQTCIVYSGCIRALDWITGDDSSDVNNMQLEFDHRSAMCDTLQVSDASTRGLMTLLEKQLGSVGCPTWRSIASAYRNAYYII